jgi:hypothetical protein
VHDGRFISRNGFRFRPHDARGTRIGALLESFRETLDGPTQFLQLVLEAPYSSECLDEADDSDENGDPEKEHRDSG